MSVTEAIVLGILQGLAEFIPVSSSGHLVALPYMLGWEGHSLRFDIALHLGTLLPLLAHSWRDWMAMVPALLPGGGTPPPEHAKRRRMAFAVLAACVPTAGLGMLLQAHAETLFRAPLLVAVSLALFGVVMLVVDRRFQGQRDLKEIGVVDGLWIGVAQVLAMVPGVSRSGSTLVAGLACGLSREASARFSFLLATPIVLGAELAGIRELGQAAPGSAAVGFPAFVAGTLTSALVGFGAIQFVLRYVQTHDLRCFVYYRWALSALMVGRGLGLL